MHSGSDAKFILVVILKNDAWGVVLKACNQGKVAHVIWDVCLEHVYKNMQPSYFQKLYQENYKRKMLFFIVNTSESLIKGWSWVFSTMLLFGGHAF